MTTQKNLPSLASILPTSALPEQLSIITESADQLLSRIRFRDLMIETSSDNSSKFVRLNIVTKELAINLSGSGLRLIFFPAADQNATESEFVISADYKWPVLKFVRSFELGSFSGSAKSFFNLILELVDISEEQFLESIITSFIDDPSPYQAVIAKLQQAQNGGTTSLADLTLSGKPVGYSDVEHIVQQLNDLDLDVFEVLFEALVDDVQDFEGSFQRLITLFQTWLGGISQEDIEDLIVPQFGMALKEISMALEVPRNVLVPINADGELIEDVTQHTRLTFTTGGVGYDTRTGFDIAIGSGTMASLTKCMVPGFGLTLHFTDIKIDLSRTTNISEADADGRPLDFMGFYVQKAIIGLPKKWFSNTIATLGIVGRNLLVGTGGISGTIGLEALVTGNVSNPELEFILGKGGKGFKIGFSHFHMKWQQNTLTESDIKGSITIPNFKSCGENGAPIAGPLKIGITAHFEEDGDFEVTAKPTTDLRFCLPDALIVKVNDLKVGKQDDLVYVSTSGELSFKNNRILSEILKDPIVIKKLKIYSDGSFDIEGGSIPLPKGARLKLGPTEVYITNLTLGSGDREHQGVLRKYQYFGFSCGLSAGSAGLDLRGDGIEFWFTADGGTFDCFLRISGIGIDLIIPGSSTPENAAVIIKGYLSIKESEYLGSIDIKLPKVKIAGGAAMRMRPKVPAWIIDAYLELSAPIPLGALPLGIYGFRGMFGYRYIASKTAAGLEADDSWVDYYVAVKPPGGKGVHVGKMLSPDATHGAKAPVSIGAGLSLATSADSGFTFSIQAFLLISLPELIMIQGKANILGTRVGLTDGEPPFFAMVAFSPGHSIEFGLGVDYKLRDDGKLLDLYAEVRAAYFFKDSSAWFVHFGTKKKPIIAQILTLFNGYSYLEISARGIEAGAGVTFGFAKKYGPVSAKVGAYFDVWGYLSFQGVQIGAGLALGGQVDVSIWGIGFGISIATMLEGTVPRPFRIAGSVEVCVYVKVLVKKFEKCFDVEFVWERNNEHEIDAIPPMPLLAPGDPPAEAPASAYHQGSGNTYKIDYFGGQTPADPASINAVIPLDSYVDFQSKKAFDANLVAWKLSGVSNAPRGNKDVVPPKPSYNDVEHSYKVHDVAIEIFVPSSETWEPYHPYEALTAGSTIANSSVNPSDLKIGSFQKTDLVYNKIRLLAQTPFSYMETSTGGYIPEQMGLTSSVLFCQERARQRTCTTWNEALTYKANAWYSHKSITVLPFGKDSKVLPFANIFGVPKSLYIESGGSIELLLPKSAVEIDLKLFSFAQSVTISYHTIQRVQSGIQTNEIARFVKSASDLLQPVSYTNYATPIDKIVITPAAADSAAVLLLEQKIDLLQEQIFHQHDGSMANAAGTGNDLKAKLKRLKTDLKKLKSIGCHFAPKQTDQPRDFTRDGIEKLKAQLKDCNNEAKRLEAMIDANCSGPKAPLGPLLNPLADGERKSLLARLEKESAELKSGPRSEKKTAALLSSLIREQKRYVSSFGTKLEELQGLLASKTEEQEAECLKAKRRLEELKANCQKIENAIRDIEAGKADYEKPKDVVDCGTYLHEVCWLTEEDHSFNQTIPSQAAIEEDFSLVRAASEQVVAPIWRPESTFRVRLNVSDSVDGGSDQQFTAYAGFKTKGPIGHFPPNKISKPDAFVPTPSPPKIPPLNTPSTTPPPREYDERLEVPETSLKYYIDEQRSYPYGGLIGQKPLYYNNPELRLFFTRPYVYHFFGNWPAYQGLPSLTGNMKIVVKDPTEGPLFNNAPAESAPVLLVLPVSTLSWNADPDPIVPEDMKVYNSLRYPGLLNEDFDEPQCWQIGGDPIKPASRFISYEVANLKPLKLYTAVVKNQFEGTDKDVHSYVFQTSRFASFNEHINSYHLKDKQGQPALDAVFDLNVALGSTPAAAAANLALALEIIQNDSSNPSPQNQALTVTYSDPFQRLMDGHFALETLSPPVGVEFNFLKDPVTGAVFALLIQSIEPINDPRIPFINLLSSVMVFEGGMPRPEYLKLFSKDCSRVILMKPSMSIVSNDLKVRFGHLAWDGRNYIEKTFVVTDNLRPEL